MFLIINWFNIAIWADLKVYENLVPDDVRKNSFLIRERVIDAQIWVDHILTSSNESLLFGMRNRMLKIISFVK